MIPSSAINILCATDDNYAPYCGIMLTSLLENNNSYVFNIYVLLDGKLSKRNSKRFGLFERTYNCRIHLVTISSDRLQGVPINRNKNIDNHSWVTIPTYYRLLSADILPKDVHKILYLDCDVAVNGDIKPLWDIDMTGKAIAGAVDCDADNNRTRMGVPLIFNYINAGVALYNLDYWRENGIGAQFMDYIQDNPSKLLLMDQDVVNGVLFDKLFIFPERYNFQIAYFDPHFWGNYSPKFRDRLIEENNNAVIIHYCGGLKPWDFRYFGCPYYSIWGHYRRLSLWRQYRVTHPTSKYIKFLLKRYLSPNSLKARKRKQWVVVPDNMKCYE